ncbi:O-antigen ligase family protein [Ilumatobacter nonamiensis]|uniref:O-antigen ligase family protein n=1 Tax=Ilumatobacter nonamiensis TaxID=467093 RepID=UPI00130DDF56|nr:O-antigen ligase family protein [Ilumatobacter nonamiensis]
MTVDERSRSIETAVEPQARPRIAMMVVVTLVALVVAAFALLAIDLGSNLGRTELVIVLAAPVGLAFGLVAALRFEWFVLAVLVVRPSLDALGTTELGPGAMLAAGFLALAIVWLVVQHREGEWRRLSVGTRGLVVFGAAVCASVTTSQLIGTSVVGALEIASGIAMFVVLEQLLVERPDRARRLVTAALCSAIIPVAVGYVHWITGNYTVTNGGLGRVRSTFVHPNPFATYLVLIGLLAVATALGSRGRQRWLSSGLAIAAACLLIATYNRSGWIAFAIGISYLAYRQARWLVVVLLAGTLVVGAAVPSVRDRVADLGDKQDFAYIPSDVPENSFEWRVQYWEELIPLANDSPVTGIGPQVILDTRPEGLEPHNVFVQVYVEIGILGLASLFAAAVAMGITLRRRRRGATGEWDAALAGAAVACCLAILVMAPGENLLNQTMSWWYLAACATWGYGQVSTR